MQSTLFDSSIYISALRKQDSAVMSLMAFKNNSEVWLSAVVLQELYAGAGENHCTQVEQMETDFKRVQRILVPNLDDWTQAGRTLAKLATKYDFEQIGRARLTNDALIAMNAARLGILVVTGNARDFGRLAEFRPFRWQKFEP